MTYLAKHCGWDKDFIAERFTLNQLKLYFEYLTEIEIADTKRMAIAFRAAQTTNEDFQEFLNDCKGITDIDQMKKQGLPIEEQ